MSLYLHDMSEFAEFLKVEPDGCYKYNNLHLYWEKKELDAYFIKADTEIAGFILSNLAPYIPDGCDRNIQEFFILRKFRRQGLGVKAASVFFKRFPGKYCVVQIFKNKPAIDFWHYVYQVKNIKYTERQEYDHGIKVLAQRFSI